MGNSEDLESAAVSAASSMGSDAAESGVLLRGAEVPGSPSWVSGVGTSRPSCSLSVLTVVVLVEEPLVATLSAIIFGEMDTGSTEKGSFSVGSCWTGSGSGGGVCVGEFTVSGATTRCVDRGGGITGSEGGTTGFSDGGSKGIVVSTELSGMAGREGAAVAVEDEVLAAGFAEAAMSGGWIPLATS